MVREGQGADTKWGEQELVDGLRLGSESAIADFLTRTHRPVYWMACRLTTDPDIRRDWTHDVLIQIVEEIGRGSFVYRWPGCFWSWFRKRAHFLLLNHLGKTRNHDRRHLRGDSASIELEHAAFSKDWNPTEQLEAVELRASIERCIEKLPQREQQSAYTLILFQECTYQEIASHLEAPLNTVRSWIRRARIAVRCCMEESLGD